jgi:hypothetical protein
LSEAVHRLHALTCGSRTHPYLSGNDSWSPNIHNRWHRLFNDGTSLDFVA